MKYDIYVINLDRNKERWQKMSAQFAHQKIENVVRYPAFDGKKLKESPEIKLVHPNALMAANRGYRISHDEHNFGSIGCYLSHVGVWKSIAESDKKFGVVLEDDITLFPNFEENFKDMINNAPLGWDMIVFGPTSMLESPRKARKRGKYVFVQGKWILFNSYVLTKECCQRFLKDVYPVRIQVDWWVSEQLPYYNLWLVQQPQLTFANELSGKSDIAHTPVVPEWLVAGELDKYQKDDKRRLPRTTDSKSTMAILSVIIVAGIVTTAVTATAVAFILRGQAKGSTIKE